MPASRGVIRRASSSVWFGFLSLLHTGSDPLEAVIIQTEVLGIGAQEHTSLGDMGVGIKLLSLEHDLALEAGLQFTETTELNHIAVSDEFSRHIGG